MRSYLITGNKEKLKAFFYERILGHSSYEVMHKVELNDGAEHWYVKVKDIPMQHFFKEACEEYGITIKLEKAETA